MVTGAPSQNQSAVETLDCAKTSISGQIYNYDLWCVCFCVSKRSVLKHLRYDTIRYCVFNVQYKTDLVVNQYFIRKKNAEKKLQTQELNTARSADASTAASVRHLLYDVKSFRAGVPIANSARYSELSEFVR